MIDAEELDQVLAVCRRHNVVRVRQGDFEVELGPPGLPPGAGVKVVRGDGDDLDEEGGPFRYAASGIAPQQRARRESAGAQITVERDGEDVQ